MMTEKITKGQRAAWTTPELRRIDAGSAEARQKTGINDVGGSGQTNKS